MLGKRIAKIKSARSLVVCLVLAGLLLSLLWFLSRDSLTPSCDIGKSTGSIRFNSTELKAVVADDNSERVKGLSGRACMPKDTVMLFIFDKPDTYGIWMKDMKFSIDILWLDADKNVVDIRENVSPSSYPEVLYPKNPSVYVIELKSTYVASAGIKVGDNLQW